MKFPLLTFFLLLNATFLQAQLPKKTGTFTGIQYAPLSTSTSAANIKNVGWNTIFQTLPNEETEHLFHVQALKEKNLQKKYASKGANAQAAAAKKTRSANPIIGINFKGNELKTWTPTDNSIAISDGGNIISCINYGVEYYDTINGSFFASQTWNAFVNDTTLKSAKFDPRVIYDKLHNRFILVILHGFSSAKSKVLACFSKSNNPLDGWNIYQLPGNPFTDSVSWTDYPTIGITNDELFINGNRFGDAPNYNWHGTYIYQIGLTEGYAGTTLQYGTWKDIFTPDSLDGITLYPASHGQGDTMKEKMYFVQLMPDSGSNVYLYEINGLLSSPSKTMTASQYAIPHYEVCANAFQKDPNSGFVDSLSTGSAWTQNAFYLNKTIHFTYSGDMGNGWCGIHYGRILLDSNKAIVSSFGEPGTDMCYPAVASFGHDANNQDAAIAFLRSDTSTAIMPEVDVISIDHTMNWSARQTVKTGDTSVNILFPPTYAIQPERWGDYTGICRKYTGGSPQVWLAGAYGANTPPRLNSFGTWIAQIINPNDPTTVKNIENNIAHKIYPNPVMDMFTIEFENNQAGLVSAKLYDVSGKMIKILFEDYLTKSMNRLAFNKLMLRNGNYFLELSRDGKKLFTEKIAVQ